MHFTASYSYYKNYCIYLSNHANEYHIFILISKSMDIFKVINIYIYRYTFFKL